MKTFVDYLSISYTPDVINQINELARQGASVKAVTSYQGRIALQDVGCDYRAELKRLLSEFDFEYSADSDGVKHDYNHCRKELLSHVGLAALDKLCHAELVEFIAMFNREFDITGAEWEIQQREKGLFGYDYSASLLCNGSDVGKVAWGCKNNGCYISLTGMGCRAVDMHSIRRYFDSVPGAKLTRLDLAYDSLDGSANFATCSKLYKRNLFSLPNRKAPKYKIFVGGQLNHGKMSKLDACDGRTFYVGKRENGKMLRCYEKGKQVQSENNPDWVRWEVEFRAKDRVIPFSALTETDDYFAGAYPALAAILKEDGKPIKTTKRTYIRSVELAVENAAVGFGKLVNFMRNVMGKTDKEIVDRMTQHLEIDEIPDRLNIPPLDEGIEGLDIPASQLKPHIYDRTENHGK
ncbi:replication initiation factor domain-containing protein [Thaumasiovibrio subtropicus]|uniref:replication initiation factor domain-containing protein n=1 Tax=Thaumasiovibrio subtropicus TaxID=1891207 RepID=UPI000B34AA15|nr:replication initiation factor domain-containing protein [Thaumasiovibrio subtropicus]